jgi:UDP:flavonoid glycosyltransferase YjiC (YdhE family)
MLRITILMLPEPGHFLPTVRIAYALRKLGHCVNYLTVAEFQDFFLDHGFGCSLISHSHRSNAGERDLFIRESGNLIAERLFQQLRLSGMDLPTVLINDVRSAKCDALLCDSVIAQEIGQELFRATGVRIIPLSTSIPDNYQLSCPEIVLCPSDFLIPGQPPIRYRHYVEPSIHIHRAKNDFPFHLLGDGRIIVYCAFGTQTQRYNDPQKILRCVIGAFQGLSNYRLVVSIGRIDLPGEMRDVPENVTVVRSAPQLDLLERAQLMITLGGLGSIKEAIVAGVPMLVIPLDNDQPSNAACVTHHGLGVSCLPAECTAQRLRELIVEMIETRFERGPKIRQMQRVFRAREAEAPSSEIVLEYLNNWSEKFFA